MILELCQSILADIKAIPALDRDGVTAFLEDDGDPATNVFRNDETRLRIMVAATGHSRRQGAGPSTDGDEAIEVSIFENPTLRSTDDDTPHLTQAAEILASSLHWRSYDGFRPLRYIDMQRADVDSSDYRMVVSFQAQAALSTASAVAWGTGEATIYGEVSQKTVTAAGSVVFEPTRSGGTAYTGTRDLHFEIDLTCSAAISSEDDLPPLGTTFDYNSKTYTTTLASITSSSEDTSTVRLQGRTLS